MLKNFRKSFESILAKIGVVSKQLNGYISLAIQFGNKVEKAINGPLVELAIAEFVPEQYQDEVEKIKKAIPEAIKYLTHSEAVLNAGTPDQIFTAFVRTLKEDAPGLQKTKIMRFLQELVALMDERSLLRCVYDLLVQKKFTAQKLEVED